MPISRSFLAGLRGAGPHTLITAIGYCLVVSTTADALVPGTVLETKRSNWQLGKIQLLDGGSDGVARTGPNGLFEAEGLFAP